MDTRKISLSGGLVALAAVIIIYWGVQSLAFILTPLLVAMVITICILPLPGRLAKKGMKPGLALILTILLVVAVLALTCFIVVASAGKLAGLLPTYTANLAMQGSSPAASSTSAPTPQTSPLQASTTVTATTLAQSLESLTGTSLSSLQSAVSPSQASGVAAAIVTAAGKAVAQVFLILFIFAFMLSAAFSLRDKTVAGFGPDSPVMAKVQEFTSETRQYMNLLTVINLLVAVGDTVFLYFMGIPFALLWGILAFAMGYIPSIGWWISLIPPFLLAWAQYGIQKALIVLVAYVVINGGVQNIIQPKLMGKGLRISPLVVFVSVIVWATLLGGMGALIAVPLTMLVMKVLESSESSRWIAVLMRIGSESEGDEDKQAFERLKGLGGKLRDAMPVGAHDAKDKETAAS
ncbi:MAG: AI-2E family transporter [Anaerolineae bacterium]|nr:AI-2E family transporter [Anaerolineae bacterium]